MNLDLFINSAMLQAITKGRHKVVEIAGLQVPRVRMRWNGPQGKSLVTLTGFGIRPYQMLAWGTQAVGVIKARVALGIGSNDEQMKPLKQSQRMRFSKSQQRMVPFGKVDSWYGRQKQRAGLNPIRDLRGLGKDSGHMLDDLRVTQATERMARIDITTTQSRVEARKNEQISPWFGFSGQDTTRVMAIARGIFQQNIDSVRLGVGGQRRGVSVPLPVWMDPYGISSNVGGAVRGLPASMRGRAA